MREREREREREGGVYYTDIPYFSGGEKVRFGWKDLRLGGGRGGGARRR